MDPRPVPLPFFGLGLRLSHEKVRLKGLLEASKSLLDSEGEGAGIQTGGGGTAFPGE